MRFLRLVMELKMGSHTGSSRIHGETAGVTMATSRWKWARICAVSFCLSQSSKHIMFVNVNSLFFYINNVGAGIATCASYPVVA